MRFIHTADWQLGKPFARFDTEVRAALTEARFDVIDSIGKAAVENGARHVLVAGDIFDTEWPLDRTIVQAVSRMQRFSSNMAGDLQDESAPPSYHPQQFS